MSSAWAAITKGTRLRRERVRNRALAWFTYRRGTISQLAMAQGTRKFSSSSADRRVTEFKTERLRMATLGRPSPGQRVIWRNREWIDDE
ncbi:hypothetical protein K426_10020 [Sphingobium sp. TKS]|nr:hypothetical protein K426_10020 [Sphingobium sp. TKS]